MSHEQTVWIDGVWEIGCVPDDSCERLRVAMVTCSGSYSASLFQSILLSPRTSAACALKGAGPRRPS